MKKRGVPRRKDICWLVHIVTPIQFIFPLPFVFLTLSLVSITSLLLSILTLLSVTVFIANALLQSDYSSHK